jgi:hypothetical protein
LLIKENPNELKLPVLEENLECFLTDQVRRLVRINFGELTSYQKKCLEFICKNSSISVRVLVSSYSLAAKVIHILMSTTAKLTKISAKIIILGALVFNFKIPIDLVFFLKLAIAPRFSLAYT